MPQHDEEHVILKGGVVVWDGITRPGTVEGGDNAGKPKWTVRCVFPPTCPDLPLFEALANTALQKSQFFAGVFPAGGHWATKIVAPGKYFDMFPGWTEINFLTQREVPQVWDDKHNILQPMQYVPLMFTGQVIDVLAHAYDYKNKSSGIAGGVSAIAIQVSANAQRIHIGGPGVDSSAAFGLPAGAGAVPPAAGVPPAYGVPPAAGVPPQQATNFLLPAQQ